MGWGVHAYLFEEDLHVLPVHPFSLATGIDSARHQSAIAVLVTMIALPHMRGCPHHFEALGPHGRCGDCVLTAHDLHGHPLHPQKERKCHMENTYIQCKCG
jgi:hypothetical protein